MRFPASRCLSGWISALIVATSSLTVHAQKSYNTAQEAYSVAASHYRAKNFKAAGDALEAALKLASDTKYKVRISRAMLAVYQQQKNFAKMQLAAEFILDNSEQEAEKSLTRRALLGYARIVKKLDEVIRRYENRLQKNATDKTALYVLSEIYAQYEKNPTRSAELIERLAKLEKSQGSKLDVRKMEQLARQYVKSGKPQEGAELYEQIAPQDERTRAWHWKEAALAWLKAGEKQKALAAARKSADSPPEKRSQLLTHFWHANLGDLFLQLGEPETAIPHLEKAIENTDIEGYVKTCQQKLEQARAQAAP